LQRYGTFQKRGDDKINKKISVWFVLFVIGVGMFLSVIALNFATPPSDINLTILNNTRNWTTIYLDNTTLDYSLVNNVTIEFNLTNYTIDTPNLIGIMDGRGNDSSRYYFYINQTKLNSCGNTSSGYFGVGCNLSQATNNDHMLNFSFVNVTNPLPAGRWTISAWVKVLSASENNAGKFWVATGDSGWQSQLLDTNGFFQLIVNGIRVNTTVIASANMYDVWHHITWLANSTNIAIYLDGNLSNETASMAPLPASSELVGLLWGNNPLQSLARSCNCILDEIKVWNDSLSHKQITEIYTYETGRDFINITNFNSLFNTTLYNTTIHVNYLNGSTQSATRYVKFGNSTAPTLFNITGPLNNSITQNGTNFKINFTCADPDKQTCKVHFFLNRTFNETSSSEFFTKNLSRGSYFATIQGSDPENNNATANSTEINFTIDFAPDIFNITYPINSTNFTTQNIYINYTCRDLDGEQCTAFLFVNGMFNQSSQSNFSVQFGDGNYTVAIGAGDGIQNSTGNSTEIFFTIDSSAPIVTVTSPTNDGVTLDGSVNVAGNASDFSTVLWCALRVDDVVIQNTTEDIATFSKIHNLQNYGMYRFDALCADENGLTGYSSNVSFSWIQNTGGGGGGGGGGAVEETPAVDPPVQIPDSVIIEKPEPQVKLPPGFDEQKLGATITRFRIRFGPDAIIQDYNVDVKANSCSGNNLTMCQVLDDDTIRAKIMLDGKKPLTVIKDQITFNGDVIPVTVYDIYPLWFLGG